MSVSFRTIKRGKKGGFEATADSIKCLEEEIHAYEALEFRWREVQVFWFPLDRATMSNVVRGRDWRPPAADPGATDTRKLRQFLEAARPPDSIISLPNWRFAHMGLLLTAWANENGPKLFLIIDLFNNGIQVDHVLAIDFDAARKRLKDALHRRCQPDVDVFSAGIHESIDVEITELHAIVKDFEERSYNVFWFNSQHFTATVFERLTTKRLLSKLRFRWTSNHSARGGNVENLASRRDEVSDAMKVPQLKRLYLVDLDQCLFSYSPNEFGKSNKAMVVAGWASYMAGAVAVTIEGAGAGAGAAAAAAGAAGAGVAGPLLVAGGGSCLLPDIPTTKSQRCVHFPAAQSGSGTWMTHGFGPLTETGKSLETVGGRLSRLSQCLTANSKEKRLKVR